MVLLRGAVDLDAVRRCCSVQVPPPYELAICRVLPEGHDGIEESLQAQREVTSALRHVLGPEAERFAVLVALDREVDDCALQWGATIVIP